MKLANIAAIAATMGAVSAFEINAAQDFAPAVVTDVAEVPQMPMNSAEQFNDWSIEMSNNFLEMLENLKEVVVTNEFLRQFYETWTNYEITTRHDAHEWNRSLIKPLPKQSIHQEYNARGITHRIKARRAANGRPELPRPHELRRMKAGSSGYTDYTGLDNATTAIMGLVSGFVYTPGVESDCANVIFDYLEAWVNGVDDFKKIYMPWVWPQVQVAIQDVVATGQVVIYDCNVNALFTTLTHLITTEGIAELGARIAGAAGFEMVNMITLWTDETVSSYKKAESLGKVLSAILNYTIA
jgi:hypothetical protein